MAPRYGCGDKVFAKVRGYPPWPARVDCIADSSPSNIKYHVFFYGTLERGVCRNRDLLPYQENKEKLAKPNKRKDFLRAINQIEGIEPVPQLIPIIGGKCNGVVKEPTNNSKKLLLKNGEGNVNKKKKTSCTSKAGISVTNENGTPYTNNVNTIDESKTKKCSPKAKFPVLNKIWSSGEIGKASEEKVELPKLISVTPECSKPNSLQLPLSRSGRIIKRKVFADEIESSPSKKKKQEVQSQQNLASVPSQKKRVPHAANNLSSPRQEAKRTAVNSILGNEFNPFAKKQSALEWLTTENCMTRLDALIRRHLGRSRANPKECIETLDNMCNLKLKPLMLKKHPEVVETIKRLRKYVGNAGAWNFSVEQLREFDEQAQEIRARAESIFDKFRKMFSAPDDASFLELFANSVVEFQKKTEDWPLGNIYSLTAEPKMRKPQDKTSPVHKSTLQNEKIPVNCNNHNSDSDQGTSIQTMQSDKQCAEMLSKPNKSPPSPKKTLTTEPKQQTKKKTEKKEKILPKCTKISNQGSKGVHKTKVKK